MLSEQRVNICKVVLGYLRRASINFSSGPDWPTVSEYKKKLLNAEVHTTQELNLLVILPDLSCERPRVRRHLNVKIQN